MRRGERVNGREEIVTIVDENNRVVGAAPRSVMRSQGLIHRATYILVFDSSRRIFVQKRAATKDVYPGYYCVATGGVVSEGETYEESAVRELEEELAIRNIPLEHLFDFFFKDTENKVWGRVFTCVYDGDITLQEEEIDSGEFRDLPEVLEAVEHERFTPDGIYVIRRYIDERGK
jgi:8-oxo-dGTP pyrophosphatase MutT (NUDIX family)